MGHEGPERSPEAGPGRRPEVVEARPVSAPAAELATLDALAERAAKSSVDTPPSPALRATSVQRLQLRAGNAAVAAMLQRRAAGSAGGGGGGGGGGGAVRKPSAALQRKPAAGGGGASLQRSTGPAAAAVVARAGAGSAPVTEPASPAGTETATKGPSTTTGTSAAGAPASPTPPSAPTPPSTPSAPSAPSAPGAPPSTPLQRRTAAADPAPTSLPRHSAPSAHTRPAAEPTSLQRQAAPIEPTPTAHTGNPVNADAPAPAPAQRRAAGAPTVQRSFASMLAEARKRAAKPSGPEDTKSVEGDTDLSDFTDKPALANQERAAIPPPPPPPKPAIPAALTTKVGEKPPPKPPKKKVGKALVAGPKGRPAKSGPRAAGAAKPGEIVKKPAPPLPPTWKKPAPGKPVAEIPAAPAPVEKLKPNQDPAFAKVIKAASLTVKKAKKHPTGKKEADSAQGAAVPPGNDIDAQAKAKRADTMATAKPKPFDEEMFVTAVKQELAKTAPKNLSEAGDVGKKAADAKGVIGSKVGASKDAAAGDVEHKSKEPPNPGDATPKPVTPMAPLEIEKPEGMKASGAMPAPVPSEAIDMREGPAKVDNEMGEAGVTEEQLGKSNEPEFTGALDAKKEGEQHSAAAPAEIRKAESAVLKQAGASAAAVEKQTVSQANTSITDAIGKIAGQKNETKSKDELKRKEVSDKINSIFDKTKADVDGILSGLDEKVDREFSAGEAEIRASFTADWKKRLGAYKSDRYSGLRGKYRWVRDKFKGLPAKANQLFEVSRKLYEDAMDKLVRRIATIVTQELTKATVRIEQGRGEVSAFVSTLKGDLAKFGQEAADDVSEKFGNLDSAVKDKFDDMASSLAKKYADSREAVNAEIEAEKEKNKGLIDKAIGAVKAVIRVIAQLKDMVLTILAKIADVIGRIIADPIGFLKRFLSAVGEGISRFAKNIGDHLQKGLMGWLFGALGASGIEIPKEFSIEGILKLVMSVLGFTWDFIKQRLAKKIGEPALNALVEGADLVKKVVVGGPGVLWEMLIEKFTDFQSMVVDEIKNFVTEKVVKAGISWILGLLTPAGAFIKACQAIYSVVMFFVERGSEIKEFVDTVIDTAGSVARGESGGIPEKIEGVLAKLLPLAISFLANLLGLGGVGDKVRSIIEKVQKPIGKAMDKVIDVVLNLTAPVWKPIKRIYEGGKKLYGKAKEKAVAAYEAGKAKVKEVGGRVKDYAKAGVAKVKSKVKDSYDWVKDKAAQQAGKLVYKGKEAYDKGKKKVTDTAKKVVDFFKVKRGFKAGPDQHQLYSSGSSHHLVVASKEPRRLDDHPDAAVKAAYSDYLQAFAAAKTPAAQKAKTKGPVEKIVAALQKWFATSGNIHPEAHAPGLGHIAPHRNQLDRFDNVPDWAMRSEHLLPRSMSNAVFTALTKLGIAMKSKDYESQHTILIYKGAASLKTDGPGADNDLAEELKDHLGEIVKEVRKTKPSQQGSALKYAFETLSRILGNHADDAEARTIASINAEHLKNGRFRAKPGDRPAAAPAPGDVHKAGHLQAEDIARQMQDRLVDGEAEGEAEIAPQTKSASMAGAGHTLKWDGTGQKKKAKLTMASQEGDLIQKIDNRVDVLAKATPKPDAEIEALQSIRAQAQAVEDIQRWKKDPKPDEAVKNALEALGDAIQRYAAMFKKKDIGSGESDEDEAKLLAKFGMPVKNAQHAQSVCKQFGVQIFVRATNPLSPERMANPDDYLPKPAYIKAKTINALDAQLGAHAGVTIADVGVVGFFQPKMPAGAESLPPEKFAALQARFHLRNAEYLEDQAKMEMKEKKGFIKIVDGKVRHAKSGKEFAGDHDIFKILDKSGVELYEARGLQQENGEWLVEDNYRKLKKQIVDALRGGAFNAQHGALLDWKPQTDRDKAIYETIKASGESLLKITADSITRA